MKGQGHLVEARLSPFLYIFIIFSIIAIFVLIAAGLIMRYFKSMRLSKKWIEKQKSQETTFQNVRNLSREAELTKAERSFLWNLCHKFHAPNIAYLYRNTKEIDELFLKEYNFLREENAGEEKISLLFETRYKLEKLHYKKLQLKSTRGLRPGTEFSYKDVRSRIWTMELIENNELSLKLLMPKGMVESGCIPEKLSRVSLSFTLQNKLTYKIITRVIRYEQNNNLDNILVVTVSDIVHLMAKRKSKRIETKTGCFFSAVKVDEVNGKKQFNVLKKKYPGFLQDISSSGCKVLCPIPIKKDQFAQFYIKIEDAPEFEATGRIVVTTKAQDEKNYVLHIDFVKISLEAKNHINTIVFGYNKKEDSVHT